MRKNFSKKDFKAEIEQDYIVEHLPPENAKPTLKRMRKIGERIEYTPEMLMSVAEQFIETCENEMITVNIPKTNVLTGEALKVTKPMPPLIDSFCTFAGIRYNQWYNYQNATKRLKKLDPETAQKFEDICEDIKDWCNSKILEYAALGWIDQKSAEFYLTNNSRYQTKIQHTVSVEPTELPAWLQGVEVAPKKQLNSNDEIETLDYVEQIKLRPQEVGSPIRILREEKY